MRVRESCIGRKSDGEKANEHLKRVGEEEGEKFARTPRIYSARSIYLSFFPPWTFSLAW